MPPRSGRVDEAVRVLKEAVALEDGIPYNEPPVWHHPPRQVLGAVLLEAGTPREQRLSTGKTCSGSAKTDGRCSGCSAASRRRAATRMRLR